MSFKRVGWGETVLTLTDFENDPLAHEQEECIHQFPLNLTPGLSSAQFIPTFANGRYRRMPLSTLFEPWPYDHLTPWALWTE